MKSSSLSLDGHRRWRDLRHRACGILAILAFLITIAGATDHAPPPRRRVSQQHRTESKAVATAMPAPLEVSCRDSGLSIAVENALLYDVLSRVGECTGAAIDAGVAGQERVSAHLGPGPALQVVGALLDQTSFNYLIAGTLADPGALQSIQLTLKPAFLESPPAPAVVVEERPLPTPAEVRANLTGGDEGASAEEVEMGTPVAASPQPAAPK